MDPQKLIVNFGYIDTILTYFSYFLGVVFITVGVFKFKRYGEMRTQMSAQMTILNPLMPFLVGVCLLNFPDFIAYTVGSIYDSPNPLVYKGATTGYRQYIKPVIILVRLIGVGAMIRGLVLLSRAGGAQSQAGSVGKAIMHILGGALAYNILKTIDLVKNIFSIDT